MRFERQVECALRIALFDGLRLRRQQDGATAIGGGALDVAVLAGNGDGLQGAVPVGVAALEIEQCIHRPGQFGVEPHGALGEMARGLRLGLALRFEEQAAQAELLGVG